jgi:hypothetical protein
MPNNLIALGLVLIGAVALSLYGFRHQRKRRDARLMPVFRSFSDEVGRVAEEGASIHVALGSGGLLSEGGMVSIAALQGLGALTELSAAYDTAPYITTGDPTLYLLADNELRRAYARLGNERSYKPNFVQFVSPNPTVYAAMAATYVFDKSIGTNINLGVFDQEVSLLVDAATSRNVKLFGGAASVQGLAALYPALEQGRLVMGEEIFTGGAEVTGRSVFGGSLWAQNILRWLVIAGIFAAAAFAMFGSGG